MGLEAVEIIMECEDEIGIRIPDADASRVVTVADLYALICRLRDPKVAGDPSATLHAIAEALAEVGIDTGAPDTSARLADLVPARLRRAFWDSLRRRIGKELPDLVGPRAGCAVATGWVTLCTIVGWLALMPGGTLLGILLGSTTAWIFSSAFRRLDPQFPPRFSTIHDLTDPASPMDALQVWRKLVTILSEQLGLRPEDVKMESRFIEDLHVG